MHPDHYASEETAAWLASLSPRARLVALLAIKFTFPMLWENENWKDRIDAAIDELDPTREEMEEIVAEAGRAVGRARMERA